MMNRQILFRGKRVADGEWVEGYYVFDECALIVQNLSYHMMADGKIELPAVYPVDPATVGQFTGEKDRDGNKIFEGDILEVAEGRYDSVSFGKGCFWMDRAMMFGEFSYGVNSYKVVGNLWDTPSLLQG